MRGQFFILGAIVILINLFILTHFISESRVSAVAPPRGGQQLVESYQEDVEGLFEETAPYLAPKAFQTYRLLAKEKSAWAYQLYDTCGDLPCSSYHAGLNDCVLNLTLVVEGRDQKIRLDRELPLSGPEWWNDTWPKRVGIVVRETDGEAAVDDTLLLPASLFPEGIWINSTRLIGEGEEPFWINDTDGDDLFDGDDLLHMRFSLAPSGSRTYYLYYSTTGIWEWPGYGYSDSVAVLEDGYWGQGGREVPTAGEFRAGLGGLGYPATPLSADQLAHSLQEAEPKVLFLSEWEKFPVFASNCSAGCEGTVDDVWLSLKEFVSDGGTVVGVAGEGFCSPFYYSGSWQSYLAGSGEYADGCTSQRLVPYEFKAAADRDQWGGDNENMTVTPEGAGVFDLPDEIAINCTAVVNTTGPRWFTVQNSTGGDAADEWSNSTSCISPGSHSEGEFVFSGTGRWLYPNGTHFDGFMDGLLSRAGVRKTHVFVSLCPPQDRP